MGDRVTFSSRVDTGLEAEDTAIYPNSPEGLPSGNNTQSDPLPPLLLPSPRFTSGLFRFTPLRARSSVAVGIPGGLFGVFANIYEDLAKDFLYHGDKKSAANYFRLAAKRQGAAFSDCGPRFSRPDKKTSLYAQSAKIYDEIGKTRKAASVREEARNYLHEYWEWTGECLQKKGDAAGAEKAYRLAMIYDPKGHGENWSPAHAVADIYHDAARSYGNCAEADKAVHHAERSLQTYGKGNSVYDPVRGNPELADNWANAAAVSLIESDPQRAIPLLEALLAKARADADESKGTWFESDSYDDEISRLMSLLAKAREKLIQQNLAGGVRDEASAKSLLRLATRRVYDSRSAGNQYSFRGHDGIYDGVSLNIGQIREALDFAVNACKTVEEWVTDPLSRKIILGLYGLRALLEGTSHHDETKWNRSFWWTRMQELSRIWEIPIPENFSLANDYFGVFPADPDQLLNQGTKDLLANIATVEGWWENAETAKAEPRTLGVTVAVGEGEPIQSQMVKVPSPVIGENAPPSGSPPGGNEPPPFSEIPTPEKILGPKSWFTQEFCQTAVGAALWAGLMIAGKETMDAFGVEKSDQEAAFGVVNTLGLWQMLALSPQTLPLLPAAIPGALVGGIGGHLIAPDGDASFHGSVIGGTASFLFAFAKFQGAPFLSRFASMRAVTLASAAARHPVTLAAVGGVVAGSLINYGVTKAQTAVYGEEKTIGDMWYDHFEFVRDAMDWSANKSPWADWI